MGGIWLMAVGLVIIRVVGGVMFTDVCGWSKLMVVGGVMATDGCGRGYYCSCG